MLGEIMNEKKLFREYPIPVDSDYFQSVEAKVWLRYHRRRRQRIAVTAFALAASVLFAVFMVQPLLFETSQPDAPQIAQVSPEPVLVPAPGSVSPTQAKNEEELVPVDFEIARSNEHVELHWQAEPGAEYLVRKCALTRDGFDCYAEAKTSRPTYEDREKDPVPLVVYRVYAQRS